MVYIHGGAYSSGSVTDPLNDGAQLAARGECVVVTVNHRLNAFGYLYLARLDPRFPDSGNCGQLDLILALQWVRDNIAAFGGDPGARDGVRPVGRRRQDRDDDGDARRQGAVPPRRDDERAAGHRARPDQRDRADAAYLAKLGASEKDLSPLLTMPAERLVDALDATDPILGGGVYFGPVLDMKWLVRHPFWPDANPQGCRSR